MNELKIEARGLFRWIKGARLVFLVLTIVGVARVIGLSISKPTAITYARFFFASPAPAPFQNPRSSDYTPESGTFFRCEGPDQTIHETKWSTEFQRAIPGPHRHYVFFLNLKKSFFKLDEKLPEYALAKAFCGNGYLAASLGCSLPVKRLELVYRGFKAASRVVECAK